MLRAISVSPDCPATPFDIVVLSHDERHLRRKLLTLQHGDQLLVDLPKPCVLSHGDRLMLEDGRNVEVIAAEQPLIEITASPERLVEIAWHIGNRHVPAQIEAGRILVERDHVVREMLMALGAGTVDVNEPFEPTRGAYHGHSERPHHRGHLRQEPPA